MRKKRDGYALLMTLMVALFLGGVSIALFAMASNLTQLERVGTYREQAIRAAESAFQRAIQEVGHDPVYTGTKQEAYQCGEVRCTIRWVVSGDYPTKQITAEGMIYRGTNLAARRTITADVAFDTSGYKILSWSEE